MARPRSGPGIEPFFQVQPILWTGRSTACPLRQRTRQRRPPPLWRQTGAIRVYNAGAACPRFPGGCATVEKAAPVMAETKVIVGGDLEEDAAAFLDAWHRVERGQIVDENVLAFESWEALASIMTGERYRLLRHVHAHPEPSVSALARALGREYRRVHADVTALEEAGLLDRSTGGVRASVDRITAEIRL